MSPSTVGSRRVQSGHHIPACLDSTATALDHPAVFFNNSITEFFSYREIDEMSHPFNRVVSCFFVNDFSTREDNALIVIITLRLCEVLDSTFYYF